eukprot:4335911-Amphidinium_carterae.1
MKAVNVKGARGQFNAVDYIIQNFRFLPNVSFSAGDVSGRPHLRLTTRTVEYVSRCFALGIGKYQAKSALSWEARTNLSSGRCPVDTVYMS